MPQYLFQNSSSGEIRDVFFHMNDDKVYRGENGDETWTRLYTVPQGATDVRLDPYSQKAFVDKIGAKEGTLGDVWKRSEELSKQREAKDGVDFVKQKYFEDYAKQRNGKRHPDEIRAKGFKFSL